MPSNSGQGNSGNTYKICLLALISAIAIIGRVGLQLINGVQPVTALMILIPLFIGLPEAILCCAVTVVVTSCFLGWGPWSVYQIVVWSLIAALARLLPRRNWPLFYCGMGVLCGYLYGFSVSAFAYRSFVTGGSQTGFLVYWLSGLYPADTLHAVGNAIFIWAFYPLFRRFVAGKFRSAF